MAREAFEGFEGGVVTWFESFTRTGITAYSASGLNMSGNYCMRSYDGGGISIGHKTVTARDEYYIAFKYRTTSDSTGTVCLFYNGTTLLGSLKRTASTGLLVACHGSTAISGGTGTKNVQINTTYLIEVRYKPHDSAGVFVVKVDGVTDIEITTGDTTDSAAQINKISFAGIANNTVTYFDDIIIDSSDWIGNTKIQAIVPTGEGTTTQFDPSTGANWECLNEITPSDTDYVSSNTTDEIDTYEMGDLAGSVTDIKCVKVTVRAAYEGSPTPTHLQLGCRSDGADYFETNLSPALTFGVLERLIAVDPATTEAWIADGLNAAEFGIKVTA